MKNTTTFIAAVLVATCAIPSVYGNEQKKIVTYFRSHPHINAANMAVGVLLEREKESGDVTIHVEKTDDPSSVVTVSPHNKVDIESQIQAHSPVAQEILNNVVVNQVELMRCLKNSPRTTEDVDRCIDLYFKTYLQGPVQHPVHRPGSVSPECYKESVNQPWHLFAKFVNDFDICIQKESDQIFSIKASGTVNTKKVAAVDNSYEKRVLVAATQAWLQRIYVDPVRLFCATLAKNDFEPNNHVSVRVTKLEVTNMQPVKTFTYEQPKMQ